MTERLISADSHVYLSDDVIKTHMSSQAAKVWDEARAKDAEYDARVNREGQPQLNIEDFVDLEASQDPGYSDARARLAAMDRDNVEAEVIFAEVGGARIANPTLMGNHWIDGVRGFNDAMADFAAADPARLLSAYQLPLYDIDLAVAEFDRLAKLGARGIQIPSFPSDAGLPDFHDPVYSKLWSRFEETGITVLNHLEIRPQMWSVFRRDPSPQKGIFTAIPAMSMAETIMFWILAGTLARHPKLKVILVEPGLGWIPWFLSLLDQRMHEHYEFPGLDALPSEYFNRQMGATFMYEPQALEGYYRALGPDSLYWSTDFPHPATCWPNSQKQVAEQFANAGISEHDRRKITSENAAVSFGLGL